MLDGGFDRPAGDGGLNLVKLCVGADEPSDLAAWQASRAAERARRGADPAPRHTTRQFPRRAEELLAGGSLYWVFRGLIRARQSLRAIDPVTGEDGIRRYDLVLDPQIMLTEPAPRRPFQGWRYLTAADAPRDLRPYGDDAAADPLPSALRDALARYGVV